MFIAMNRFKVPKGSEQAFEELWLSRETHLDGNPGFVVFHLLEGPARQDHVLYFLAHDLGILAFEAWTRSEVLSHGSCQGRVEQAPLPRSSGVRGVHRFARGEGGRRLIHQAGQLG